MDAGWMPKFINDRSYPRETIRHPIDALRNPAAAGQAMLCDKPASGVKENTASVKLPASPPHKEFPMAHIPETLLGLGKISDNNCDVTVATRENVSSPLHTHPTTNYVTVSEGTLYLTLDGVERPVLAGEWCKIPAGAEHTERFTDKTSVIVFWVKAASSNS
jgi:quercetin dioxygenase-like cupin family protein